MDIIKLRSDSFFNVTKTEKEVVPDLSAFGIFKGDHEVNVCKWKNRADIYHSALVGDDVYEDLVSRQFEEAKIQSTGLLSDLNTRLKKTKADFFRAQKITYPGYDCTPRPVGGAGFAKIVSNPFFPPHKFFREGRIFSIRLRHNNFTFTDDAMLDGRVTCLKFQDADTGGNLDLILYTGHTPPYYNSTSFQEFARAMNEGEKGFKTWIFEKPINYTGRIDSVRRNPTSYHDQHYYAPVTYEMTSADGSRWLTRLRLIPVDGQSETGLPENADQENAWKVNRWKSETRDYNYLRNEFKMRLRGSPLQYRLQMQMRNCDLTDPQVLNASVEWKEKHFTWHDVALLTLTHPLPQHVLAKTQFDILANPPASFKPIEPRSMKDFCSLAIVIREFHGVTANSQSEEKDAVLKDTLEVTVVVKTGNFVQAGTDADIYFTIIGKYRRTESIYLDTPFHDDFEAGCTDTFNITIPNVGPIVALRMELRSILSTRKWYMEYVTLDYTEDDKISKMLFPCYQWLTSAEPSIQLRAAKGLCFHQENTMYGLFQRRFEVEKRKEAYVWENIPGLPGRIQCSKYDLLPRSVKFRVEKERDLTEKYLRTLANSGVSVVTTLFEQEWNIFTEYDKLLNNVLKDKKIVRKVEQIWKDDKEFGRQILNGPHPSQIKRMTEIPDDVELKILDVLLVDILDRGKPLALEIANGYVYMLEYPELAQLEQCRNYKGKYDRYITCPKCYLYSNNNGDLLPIFIKIPSENGTLLFTPKDSTEDWLLAKMWVREADAQIHQVIARHLKTQLAIEAISMATMRNLPSVHPVFKLLLPHLRYTIGLNVLGRQSLYPSNDGLFHKLLAVGGQHMDLLKIAYCDFDFSELHFINTLKKQGVDDVEKLPNYYYRDDGIKIWEAINKFVRTVIYLHYWTAENVRADSELQEWITDMKQHGFPMAAADNTDNHGLPESFHNLDMLVEFLTTIIFTATGRNSSLTLGMMDYYSYVPNIPTMLLKAPPREKGTVTMDSIKDMLPSRGKSAEIIAACYTLSRFGRDEVFLGEFPEEYFSDDTIKACCMAFTEDLDRIATDIKRRNSEMDIPYTYLQPGNISNSISM